jgi:hypothetical protein
MSERADGPGCGPRRIPTTTSWVCKRFFRSGSVDRGRSSTGFSGGSFRIGGKTELCAQRRCRTRQRSHRSYPPVMVVAKRVVFGLVVATAFGVAAGVFKGNETGLRAGIGNLSAPWLLVAVVPALRCRTLPRGALMGLSSTLLALAGFYAVLTVILAGQLGGRGFLAESLVEVRANRVYLLAGVVTGPLFGAVGAWIGRHHPRSVRLLVGFVLAGEALAVALLHGHQVLPAPLFFRWSVADWKPYIGESLLGVVVILAAIWQRSSSPPVKP